jgi:hypothetical protein
VIDVKKVFRVLAKEVLIKGRPTAARDTFFKNSLLFIILSFL